MSGFSVDWLAQREPHDAAARATEILELCRDGACAARPSSDAAAGATDLSPARARRAIVDLGAGTGANLRWLAPRLGGEQAWNLVDHDDALLAAAERALRAWSGGASAEIGAESATPSGDREELVIRAADFSCRVRRTPLDLASDLARIEMPSRALVTASSLLDLVSEPWLGALAQRCRAAAADVYFTLTYDGRTACSPAEPEDSDVLELFNRHQRRDKGFGPALGPTAARRATEIFTALGYRVTAATSDWRIAAHDASFQRSLLAGWLVAALEIAPERAAALRDWHARRISHVDARRSEVVVGHVDLVGCHTR